jgi:hypothetical protein
METEQYADEELTIAFTKQLNQHGYSFQYAVLKKCGDVARILEKGSAASTWLPLASEFPVGKRGDEGRGTKIDFVLRRVARRPSQDRPVYLLAECKRANPALSNWCFAKASYVHHAWPEHCEPFIGERFQASGEAVGVEFYYTVPSGYHIGTEVRSKAKGDSEGEKGQAIEKASSQILRGLNGFIETLNENPLRISSATH